MTIENAEGEQETIDSTPEHPFYVEGKGWVNASALRAGMVVWLADGTKAIIQDVWVEYLAEAVAVFNFKVEDFHTYFIGYSGVLVHNANCGQTNITKDDLTGEVLETKPSHSPNPEKWIENGGSISIDADGIWSYTSKTGETVSYIDGYPDFKSAGYVIQESNVGEFKGYGTDFRNADLNAPKGPKAGTSTWHHHQDGQTMQEIPRSIHSMFTHIGGMAIKRSGG